MSSKSRPLCPFKGPPKTPIYEKAFHEQEPVSLSYPAAPEDKYLRKQSLTIFAWPKLVNENKNSILVVISWVLSKSTHEKVLQVSRGTSVAVKMLYLCLD